MNKSETNQEQPREHGPAKMNKKKGGHPDQPTKDCRTGHQPSTLPQQYPTTP